MMHKSRQWNVFRTSILTLGLLAGASAGVHASPVINYSTSGAIDSTGVTGTPVISFNSLVQNTVDVGSGSNLSLGDFQVAGLPGNQTTTYNNTPFNISLLVNQVDGTTPNPNQTPLQISGELNGTVVGNDTSNVTATFNPLNNPNFQTGLYENTLSVPSSKSLVASTTNSGQTSGEAVITSTTNTQPTPEPTSIAFFLMCLGGIGLRHRIRRHS
ncbi:MAG: hypothetical protein JO116_26540 [Planctomycetaceae bacterium]|nr:hypothetical protein [Planctomycetaceae bacterium]